MATTTNTNITPTTTSVTTGIASATCTTLTSTAIILTAVSTSIVSVIPLGTTVSSPHSCNYMTVSYDSACDLAVDGRISPSVIPLFDYLVTRWTISVIRTLNAAGGRNYRAPKLAMQVIPILLTRLPNDQIEIISI